jgi:hypothetical protein
MLSTVQNIGFAQFDSIILNQKTIIAYTEFRNEIYSDTIKLAKFLAIQQKWDENKISKFVQKNFVESVFYYSKIKGLSYERFLIRLKDNTRFPKILLHFNKDDYQIILENYRLAEFIGEDFISFDYPFELSNFKKIQDELLFYDLKDSLHIGEIGAGSGHFSFLLNKIYVGQGFCKVHKKQ